MLSLLRDRNFIKTLIIILALIFLYSAGSSKIRPLKSVSLKTQDVFYNIRHKLKPLPPNLDDIVVVSVDSEDFDKMRVRWPWPRDMFALLIEKLNAFPPSLICMDLAFVGQSANPEADKRLVQAMSEAGNVIIASHFREEGEYIRYIKPDQSISEAALAYGFINKNLDVDYFIRRTMPVFLSKDRAIDYSFALKSFAKYRGYPLENITYDPALKRVILQSKDKENYTIDLLKRNKAIYINYLAGAESFKRVPYWKVVAGGVDPKIFKNKMVLVGITAEILHDMYQTPLGRMPGVLINANEILMLLNKALLKDVSGWVSILAYLILAIIVLIITYRLGLLKGFFAVITFLILGFLVNLYLLFLNYNWDFFGAAFVIIGAYITTYAYKSIGLLIDNMILRKEATTDGLTDLYVYRYFELKLRNEFNRAKELKKELALIILDIDYFKPVNDTYGHEEGNLILKELAHLIAKLSRRTDTPCRYGGEEFCMILPDTKAHDAQKYAEGMRIAIEAHEFPITSKILRLTASFGIAAVSEDMRDYKELIKRADAALYRAKQTGRNKVILYNKT